MFHAADVMLINKIDLLPYLRFDMEKCKDFARRVNPDIRIFELSCHSGEGMDAWYDWLAEGVRRKGR
jgi:hydrogenase nickel incorporation protein HypB